MHNEQNTFCNLLKQISRVYTSAMKAGEDAITNGLYILINIMSAYNQYLSCLLHSFSDSYCEPEKRISVRSAVNYL